MDCCPLCESVSTVASGKPCYLCGFVTLDTAHEQTAAVVPGRFLFESADSSDQASAIRATDFAESVLARKFDVEFLMFIAA
jgi:hypothetical protein